MPENLQRSYVGAMGMSGVSPERDDEYSQDDLRNVLPLDMVRPEIRQSTINTYYTCPRAFLFRERFGVVPGGYKPAPFIGQLFHLIHAGRLSGRNEIGIQHLIDDVIEDYKSELVTWCESHPSSAQGMSDVLGRVERDAALARIMSELHWREFPLNPDEWEILDVESDYHVKLPWLPQSIGGRLDLVLRHLTPPKGLVIVDHKTTGQSLRTWIDTSHFAIQPKIYRLCLSLGGVSADGTPEPIIGALFNLVRRPTISWKIDKQDFQTFLEECQDWYAGRCDRHPVPRRSTKPPKKDGGAPKGVDPSTWNVMDEDGTMRMYPRWDHSLRLDEWREDPPMKSYFLPFSQREPLIDDELRHLLVVVSRASCCRPSLANFPRTGQCGGHCRNLYGKECPYLKLCSTSTRNWEQLIHQHYTIREALDVPSELPEEIPE